MSQAYHILSLDFENYKKLKAVSLELSYGEPLRVVGPSGQGKTTAITALWEILTVLGDPITHGEKKGAVRVRIGSEAGEVVTIERRYTAKTNEITIQSDNGKIGAREFATWFCALAENPHKLMEMRPTERLNTLLSAIDLGDADLAEIDKRREDAANERLIAGRIKEKSEKSLPTVATEKAEAVDITALLAESARIQDINATYEEGQKKLKEITEEIAGLEASLRILSARKAEITEWLAHNPPLDYTEIKAKVDGVAAQNEKALLYTQYLNLLEQSSNDAKAWTVWDEKVKAIDTERKDVLENAVFPLPGLTISDSIIYYNGTPIEQLGTSEQILICGAISAAAIVKKPLRVVRLDGVESMGEKDLAALMDIYQKNGIQVLASRVSRGDIDEGETIIVDGGVKEWKPS